MRVRFDYRNSTKMWNEWNTIGETAHTLNRQETVMDNNFFLFPFCRLSNHIARKRLDCLTAQKHSAYLFVIPQSTLYWIPLLFLLADYMTTVPSTNVVWGIRLPRMKFRGHRAGPNTNCFGRCLMSEKAWISDDCTIAAI